MQNSCTKAFDKASWFLRGEGTQVPGHVDVIATERDDAISTNSILVFGFHPDSSII